MDNLYKLVDIVGEAGQVLKDKFNKHHFDKYGIGDGINFKHKEARELQIEEDIISQDILINGIDAYYPQTNVYSEELNNIDEIKLDRNKKFIIDPLDGTHNYCFANFAWGISLAYLNEENDPLTGIIYLPMLNIFLFSTVNSPFTCLQHNFKDTHVQTSNCRLMKDAIVCYDNQFYKFTPTAFKIYEEITKQCFTTRITGSAAHDAAMVALGKVTARIWNSTNSYDIAAAILIVRKAGGIACNFNGEDASIHDKEVFVCANNNIKKKILNIIKKVRDNEEDSNNYG